MVHYLRRVILFLWLVGSIMFSGCPSVRASRERLLARYFIDRSVEFHQIYNFGAAKTKDELIGFGD